MPIDRFALDAPAMGDLLDAMYEETNGGDPTPAQAQILARHAAALESTLSELTMDTFTGRITGAASSYIRALLGLGWGSGLLTGPGTPSVEFAVRDEFSETSAWSVEVLLSVGAASAFLHSAWQDTTVLDEQRGQPVIEGALGLLTVLVAAANGVLDDHDRYVARLLDRLAH